MKDGDKSDQSAWTRFLSGIAEAWNNAKGQFSYIQLDASLLNDARLIIKRGMTINKFKDDSTYKYIKTYPQLTELDIRNHAEDAYNKALKEWQI